MDVFFIEDDDLLEKYNAIWNKVSADIKKDSALKKVDSYYPQVFSNGCKYIEKKVVRHIHDNLTDFF